MLQLFENVSQFSSEKSQL